MKVKIVRCSSTSYWYFDKIGEVFEVSPSHLPNNWEVVTKGGDVEGYLLKTDCEVVTEEPRMKVKFKNYSHFYIERLGMKMDEAYDVLSVNPTTYTIDYPYEDDCVYILKEEMEVVDDVKPTNPKDVAATTRLDISVFPQTAIVYGALGMTEGAYKYGAYNYREMGVNVSVYYSAAMRHMFKYYNGEEVDPKTGVPHLASALSCIAIIIDGEVMGNLVDDRPPKIDMESLLNDMMDKVSHLQETFPEPKARCTAS